MAKVTEPRQFHLLHMFQSFKAKIHREDRDGHKDPNNEEEFES